MLEQVFCDSSAKEGAMRNVWLLCGCVLVSSSSQALELKKCWPDCSADIALPVSPLEKLMPRVKVSLSVPLTASELRDNAAPEFSSSGVALPASTTGFALNKARPELSWNGDEHKGKLRLYGNKVRLNLQSLDEAREMVVTIKPEEVKLQMQWHFN